MKKLLACLAIASILVSCEKTKQNDAKAIEITTNAKAMSEADKLSVESKKTLDIANAYMAAMGKGDMETMTKLMHEDMVWQNAGDSSLPWMGPWEGKKAILEEFMPAFGAGFKTIKWEPVDALSNGDTAAYFGQMIGELTNS